jgi:O-antigen/teichoic acid export membrane protein
MKLNLKNQSHKLLALSDQVLVSGTNFTVGILITRLIGIEDYGRFTLYWMIFLFLHGLCNSFIGLPSQIISNQMANKSNYLEENNRLGSVVLIVFITLLYPAFYLYDYTTDASFGYGYWLFPLVILLYLKQEMNRKYFYAKLELKKVILIDSCSYLLQIPSLLILSLFFDMSLNLVLLNLTLFGTLGQLLFVLIKAKTQTSFEYKNLPISVNWNYSKHLITTSILQWFSGNILILSAGPILGIAAVGIIRVLQNIMGVLHVLFLTLENVVPVKASLLLHNHGKQHMFTYFKKVFIVTGAIYGIILILLKLSGALILTTLYGEDFAQYTNLLDIFILLYIFVFIGTIAQLIIKTLNLNIGISIAYGLTAITAFVLSTPLLELFDIKGVIIGLGLFQIITISTYYITIKRSLR